MKHTLALLLYHAGDLVSRTTMVWFDGNLPLIGYPLYSRLMDWSAALDTKGRIWSYDDTIQPILDDPELSDWLKDSVRHLINTDPCDAVQDAKALYEIMLARIDKTFPVTL